MLFYALALMMITGYPPPAAPFPLNKNAMDNEVVFQGGDGFFYFNSYDGSLNKDEDDDDSLITLLKVF